MFKHKCPLNLCTLSREDILKLNASLLKKLKTDLKNKYKQIILEKNFNIETAVPTLKKVIDDYNYVNYEDYPKLLIMAERKFLPLVNKAKYSSKATKVMHEDYVRDIIFDEEYDFNHDEPYYTVEKKKRKVIPISKKEKEEWDLQQYKVMLENEKKIQNLGIKKGNKKNLETMNLVPNNPPIKKEIIKEDTKKESNKQFKRESVY